MKFAGFNFLKQNKGLTAGLFTLLIFIFFRIFPGVSELVYSRFLYQGFRIMWDDSLGLIPIPIVWIFLISFLIWIIVKIIRRKKGTAFSFKIFSLGILSWSGWILTVFFWFWGFNYARPQLSDSLELNAGKPNQILLEQELHQLTDSLAKNRVELNSRFAGNAESDLKYYPLDAVTVAHQLSEMQLSGPDYMFREIQKLGLAVKGHPRAWISLPKGTLYRLACSGIYIPFFGEAYVESAQHFSEIPFTYFHELAHACGIADEGDANFVAWYVCEYSDNPYWKLSARLEYFDYLLSDFYRSDSAQALQLKAALPEVVTQMRYQRKLARQQYPAWFPGIQGFFYDFYLTSVGVPGGIKSYNHLVGKVLGWKAKHPVPQEVLLRPSQ